MKSSAALLMSIVVLSLVCGGIGCSNGVQPTLMPTPTPTATPTPSPTPTPTPKVWSDGMVSIVVDKVEKTTVVPPEILRSYPLGQNKPKNAPSEGNEFVCIYLTITQIKDIHVLNASGGGLFDNSGRTVGDSITYSFPAQINDIIHPELNELREGTAIIVYEVPEHQELASLRIVYAYKRTWEEPAFSEGQLDINL